MLNRLDREPCRLERRRPSLARFRQRPVDAPAYAILRHARDAPSEYRFARECELCPDHQFLALGMLVLRGQIAAVEGVRIGGDLPRVLRVRCAENATLLLAAPRRHGADGGEADGEPQATLPEPRAHEKDLPPPVAGKQANWLNGSMALARGEAVREVAAGATRPGDVAQALESAPALLMRLQRTAGNAAVCRLLAGAVLARQPAPAGAPTVAATVGSVGGKRPSIKETTKEFDDCNAAVEWLNSGAYTGEAQPVYKPTAGKIRSKKLPDGTLEAAVDITWAYDAASSADVIVPTWPDMTKADKDAVNKYKAALRAHEVMHFDVTDKIVKALPLTVKATGSDPQDATTNLQAAADTHQSDAQTAIDTATTDYDTKTGHGANQAAVGGANVHLTCPSSP